MVKCNINDFPQLLSYNFGKEVQVLDSRASYLTKPGENYGSVILALDVTIKDSSGKVDTLNLCAKLIPTNDLMKAIFDIQVTFKKEVFVYLETIPTLVALQKEYGIPKQKYLDKITPKCYAARINLNPASDEVDKNGIILCENLKRQGYKSEDRLVGFDLQTCEVALNCLARLHGVSLALKILKPEIFREKVLPGLKRNKCFEHQEGMRKIFHDSIIDGAREIEELAPFMGKLQEIIKFRSQVDNFYSHRPQPKELFATFSHTDYWTSNILILREENGKAVNAKFIDFQLGCYDSTVRDVLFFLFTTAEKSVFDSHFDYLVKFYYNNFVETLKEFEIDTSKYDWNSFMKEMNEVAPTELYHILYMLKPIFVEEGKVKSDLQNFKDEDFESKDLLGSTHRRKLKQIILEFNKRRWLDSAL